MVGDEDAWPSGVQPVPVRDVDPPSHEGRDPAAEDPSIKVQRLAVAGADEEPEDPGGGAEKEPESPDEKTGEVGESLSESAHSRSLLAQGMFRGATAASDQASGRAGLGEPLAGAEGRSRARERDDRAQ